MPTIGPQRPSSAVLACNIDWEEAARSSGPMQALLPCTWPPALSFFLVRVVTRVASSAQSILLSHTPPRYELSDVPRPPPAAGQHLGCCTGPARPPPRRVRSWPGSPARDERKFHQPDWQPLWGPNSACTLAARPPRCCWAGLDGGGCATRDGVAGKAAAGGGDGTGRAAAGGRGNRCHTLCLCRGGLSGRGRRQQLREDNKQQQKSNNSRLGASAAAAAAVAIPH